MRIFTEHGEHCFFAYNIPGELSEKMEKRGVPSLQLSMGRLNAISAAKSLAEFCRANKIDVIHAQYPRENITALLSLRYYPPAKVIYTNHLTIRTGLRWRILNKIFTPKDHRIIAVCREGRDIMIQNGVCPDRIQVIYNGVEPAGAPVRDPGIRQELGISEDTFVMSILARYEPEKGLPFLLDCISRLRACTDRPFVCLLCGDGSEFESIGAAIREKGLSDAVRQLGYRTDTSRILHGSDLYLNTSSCNEAMSFAILEAMNAGLPLVVTDVGGNRDLAETDIVCGFVLNYGDVEGFSQAVLRLMEDTDLRRAYSENAVRKVAEAFDLNKLALDVLESYN